MNNTLHTNQLTEGFTDAVHQSQTCFRSILKAMSEPGLIETLTIDAPPPQGMEPACWALLLTLLDVNTSVWLSPSLAASDSITSNLRFHCQATMVEDPQAAGFALCNFFDIPPPDQLNRGSPEYPDQSTTLIIQTPAISNEPQWQLSGPGIPSHRPLHIAGLSERFQQELISSRKYFPGGIDCIFTCNNQLTALPRSTRITTGES